MRLRERERIDITVIYVTLACDYFLLGEKCPFTHGNACEWGWLQGITTATEKLLFGTCLIPDTFVG